MPVKPDTPPPAPAARQVRCPQCGTLTVYAASNPWRPFCSERCKSLDLGAWASESYRVPATPPLDADDAASGDEPPSPPSAH
ncbi:DNA gyrase inhibitor YacG [Thiomonas sp.]|uniref:DNA gyrase inhibitor YacG n=1 Tax=Thiomonas sp. TaxID=2047785 RepID=UPI0026244FAA|nr:DNA gyrase inhibitor YacG [Thiomonas sp.]